MLTHREKYVNLYFSPKVGKQIQSEPTAEELEIIRKDGSGTLTITEIELGNLKPGEKADITSMKFEVKIKFKSIIYTPLLLHHLSSFNVQMIFAT